MSTTVATTPSDAGRAAPVERSTVQLVPPDALTGALEPRRVGLFAATWGGVLLLGVVLVLYGIGPFLHSRDQRVLLESFRGTLSRAANEAYGLDGVKPPTKAPVFGEPIAILEIGSLQVQEVVVEGASSAQTQRGPGHVPGTAKPGQPYNSVIVGRSNTFGGPFSRLGSLHQGDPVLVTTTEGQRVYTVEAVRRVELEPPGTSDGETVPSAASASSAGKAVAPGTSAPPGSTPERITPGTSLPMAGAPERVAVDDLYALGDQHELTLVTSDSASPMNSSEAVVVTAKMRQVPYVDWTPPNGRTDAQTGLTGDSAAMAPMLLAVLGFVVAAAVAVALYSTRRGYVAYLLSTPPLLAFVVLGAEMLSRLLPAWT